MNNFKTPTINDTSFKTPHFISEFTLSFKKKESMAPDKWAGILSAMLITKARKIKKDANIFVHWAPWANNGYTFNIFVAYKDEAVYEALYDTLPECNTEITSSTEKCHDDKYILLIEYYSEVCPDSYFAVREKDGCLGFKRKNCCLTYDADFTFITLNEAIEFENIWNYDRECATA